MGQRNGLVSGADLRGEMHWFCRTKMQRREALAGLIAQRDGFYWTDFNVYRTRKRTGCKKDWF